MEQTFVAEETTDDTDKEGSNTEGALNEEGCDTAEAAVKDLNCEDIIAYKLEEVPGLKRPFHDFRATFNFYS